MRILPKSGVIGLAIALTAQPCSAEARAAVVATTAAPVALNLKTHAKAAAAHKHAVITPSTTALSAHAAIAAQEAEERERRKMSRGAKTALIIGGVVLVGVIVLGVFVASNKPSTLEW